MKKIEEIVASLIDAADTCEEVEEYFKNGNTPKGPYIDLAKYFLDDNYLKRSKGDEAYKKWLRELIHTKREQESIVLSVLKKKYQTKEYLERFVFLLNGLSPQLNQKWHFFIGYWGLREYITKYPENNSDRLTPLKKGNKAYDGNPFKKCTEGEIWYNCMMDIKQKNL